MSSTSYEITAASIRNQEWKCKVIIGYGVGMYIGTGVEAQYIAKASDKEIGTEHLMAVYQHICDRHNASLKTGNKVKERRPGLLARLRIGWILKYGKEKQYNYPADVESTK